MDSSTAFLDALSKFVANFLRGHVLIDGIVTDVNDNFTVDITVNDVPFTNVPTKVVIGSQASIYEIPVIGTVCLVKWRDGHRNYPQIDSFNEVDKYYIQPISNLYISAPKTIFNDGENGGIPLAQNVSDQINTIITQQNEILTILKSIIVPTTTPYPFEPLFSAVNDLDPIDPGDIENPDISQ